MALQTGAGVKFFIGTTVVATNITEYEAATPWVEIGEIESLGDFGDEFNPVEFLALADGRKRKLKGSADAGDLNPVCAYDPADVGQIALIAAAAVTTSVNYNFKIELNDGATTPTTFFFSGVVGQRRNTVEGTDNVLMLNTSVWINTALLTKAST